MTLVLTNLIPLAGYIWLGWELYDLMILYWLESAVVGLFTVARMLTAKQGGFPSGCTRPYYSSSSRSSWSITARSGWGTDSSWASCSGRVALRA